MKSWCPRILALSGALAVCALLQSGTASRESASREQGVPASLGAAVREARHGVWTSDGTAQSGEVAPGEIVTAGNPAQRYSTRFEDAGACVSSGSAGWSLELSLSAFGTEGAALPVGAPARWAEGRRVEYRREGVVEWYRNGDAALEHGFDILRPPTEVASQLTDRLELVLECETDLRPHIASDGTAVEFMDGAGVRRVSYSKLLAFDASGRDLPARMATDDGRLRILVDARGAAYPVTVDPVIYQDAYLYPDGIPVGDRLGWSAAISGDTAVIGMPGDDEDGRFAGAALVLTRSGSTWSQQAKLLPDDGAPTRLFGASVSIDGETAVVGASVAAGSVYVFVRNAGVWSQQAKLTAPDGAMGDHLGTSVAISGDTLVSGAELDKYGVTQTGSVYVFVRSGTVWSYQDKLQAADGAFNDRLGESCAIDGDTVVAGSHLDDDNGASSGSAYVWVRSGTVWSQQAKLLPADGAASAKFGASVSISGDSIIAGSPMDGATNDGAAYVFVRSGTVWSQQAKLMSAGSPAFAYFGDSVAIDGDTAAMGAPNEDDSEVDAGAAYVFVRSGTVWSQQARLTASPPERSDTFGFSIAVDSDTVVVGAPDAGSDALLLGTSYAFHRSGNTWSQQVKFPAAPVTTGAAFGCSVSMSGDTAVVGADTDEGDGSGSGAAYVFIKGASTWTRQARLLPSDGASADRFGWSVSISGDTTAVGAYGKGDLGSIAGAAYVFTRAGTTWSQQAKIQPADIAAGDCFGYAVSVMGDTLAVGACMPNSGSGPGATYVYVRSVTTWQQQARLVPDDGASYDRFGRSVSLDVDTLVIGSPRDDDNGSMSGSAYVFVRSGSVWSHQAKLLPSVGAADDRFGYSVSVDGDTAVVGSIWDDGAADCVGAVFVFVRTNAVWSQQAKLVASDADVDAEFGSSVAVRGDTVVVGAIGDDEKGASAGAGYVFHRADGAWSEHSKLLFSMGAMGDWTGFSVAFEGTTAVVGSIGDNAEGDFGGSVSVFDVPAVATRFSILEPTDSTVDGAIAVDLEVRDQYGDLATGFQDDVTLYASGTATGGGLVDIVNGVGSASISCQTPGTVTIGLVDTQSTGLSVASTCDVVFDHGVATHIVFDTQPSDVPASLLIAPTVGVEVCDQYDNACTSGSYTVNVVLGGGSPGSSLGGVTAAMTSSGVAAFPDLSVDVPGIDYALTAQCGALADVVSSPFDVTGPPVSGLVVDDVDAYSIGLSWTNPSLSGLAGVVILRSEDVAPTFVPSDGAGYDVGTTYGDAVCVHNGADESFTDTGLDESSHYHYVAFAYFDAASPAYTVGVTVDEKTPPGPAPVVEFVFPGPGADAVDVRATVEITFSEPMDVAQTESAVAIDGGVTGQFAWSGTTLVFTPDAILEQGTTYTVTIDTGACDLVGLPIGEAISVSFVTEQFTGVLGGGCVPSRSAAPPIAWLLAILVAVGTARRGVEPSQVRSRIHREGIQR